ncbi:MAG: hypothetical protein AABW79_03010 [Nanoarchaeota archaeon]
MNKEEFVAIVRSLKKGDLIEIVREDPSQVGFFKDDETGKKKLIRQPCYFDDRANISSSEPGISVTLNKNAISGRLEAGYSTISYMDIIEITKR